MLAVQGELTAAHVRDYKLARAYKRSFEDVSYWRPSIVTKYSWLQEFTLENGPEASVDSLARMFSEISYMLERREFIEIDEILQFEDPRDYNIDFVTGILRATFSYRAYLPYWGQWLLKAKTCIADMGENPESELAGLM